jgi:EAL domain-containing protein (putative c-di-GMP-specific phosphodiesterase class I)
MRPMTRHVLEVALRQCARWRRDDPHFTVAVNLSPHSLYEEHIVEDVRDALARHSLPPEALVLELTESTVMRDLHRGIETLNQLRGLGVELSVDDFGTGYSSLASLRRLPVQEVKIDKAFVLNAGEDPDDAAVVGMVVALGHQLGLRVCAEGVETVRAWELLVSLACDHAQGYLLSRPLSVADFEQLLAVARTPERDADATAKNGLRLIA